MTEIQNLKQKQMNRNEKKYDLEERTFEFARDVRRFVKKLTKTLANIEDGRQLIRSSGSIGANYIEANESLSKKDFLMRIKISRKEAKESRFWLRLLDVQAELEKEHSYLFNESVEITNIFGAILRKTEG
ncbi:MAG TPA: four helix bundle protein [Candidatus Deferrimicrobium sp.]|nr:four helix bundle protein [Candidatus Deferrimicrobium sp.]